MEPKDRGHLLVRKNSISFKRAILSVRCCLIAIHLDLFILNSAINENNLSEPLKMLYESYDEDNFKGLRKDPLFSYLQGGQCLKSCVTIYGKGHCMNTP